MPFYDYDCRLCGTFSLFRALEDRNLPVHCSYCQSASKRVITAPNLSLLSASRRSAHARNEKSQHEPGLLNRHRCGSGCGCGQVKLDPGTKRTVEIGRLGKFQKQRRSKRPWMLGH